MRKFWRNVPAQIMNTYGVMVLAFSLISHGKGVETIDTARLLQLFGLAVIGGILMELAFGTVIIRTMSDFKRVWVFTVPFCIVTFLFAAGFGWITQTEWLSTYLVFIGIFLACGSLAVLLFELEHHIRGKRYTEKLKAYQHMRRQA